MHGVTFRAEGGDISTLMGCGVAVQDSKKVSLKKMQMGHPTVQHHKRFKNWPQGQAPTAKRSRSLTKQPML